MTFTWTVWLSASPKPLYAVQLKVPESFLLTFVIVSTFPTWSTLFPWFPAFSSVQVMFASGLPDALHVNFKLPPSRTVCSPLIWWIFAGTNSRKLHNTLEWHLRKWMTLFKNMFWQFFCHLQFWIVQSTKLNLKCVLKYWLDKTNNGNKTMYAFTSTRKVLN